MTQRKFSTNLSFIGDSFLGLNIIAIIVYLTAKGNEEGFLVVYLLMNASVFFFFLFKRNVVAVVFGENEIEIVYWKMFLKKREAYKYKDLFWSNRKTIVGRGNVDYVLKLYCNEETIASLHPWSSGFEQGDIDNIKEAIIENGIKQQPT